MAHTYIPLGSHSPIMDLPNEVLLIIFKFAYVTARRFIPFDFPCDEAICWDGNPCICDVRPEEEYTPMNTIAPPFTPFPYSLALVCPRWRQIMLGFPTFWTRIIIPIDDSNTPSSLDLDLQLCASGDQPINVVVTRASFQDVVGLKDVEQLRMSQIITTLRLHLHRCRTLRIETVHSSSLPRLSVTLPAHMPHIRELSLESRIDSGCPKVQPYSQADDMTSMRWCSLRIIAIDGWNFTELYDCVPTPSQQIFSACSSISLKFGGEGHSSNCIRKVVEECDIENLRVDSVNFTQGDDSQEDAGLSMFTLKNLSAEVTGVMLRVCDFAMDITIDNCSATLTEGITRSNMLSLKNIGPDQGLENMFQLCSGRYLAVGMCPGFDDNILTMLGTTNQGTQESYLNGTENLAISGCHGFTVDALKRLVESRARNDMMFGNLFVGGHGSSLSKKNIRWFQDRVTGKFNWLN